MKVYILESSDGEGRWFEGCWKEKPTEKQVADLITEREHDGYYYNLELLEFEVKEKYDE